MAKKSKSGKGRREAPRHAAAQREAPQRGARQDGAPPGSGSASRGAWRWGVAALLIVAGGVAALVYLAGERDRVQARANLEAAKWAADYWQRPIAEQGPPPSHYLDAAKSLQPEDCGACHPAQFAGWKDSLHAAAMGAGVVGQFPTMSAAEQAECYACHAPLSEQYPSLPGTDGMAANAAHDAGLAAKGLVCAACHLRKHQRHGPPLRPEATGVSGIVHGDPVRTPFFESSEFCKGCHQHPDTAMKVNGKTVENTYNEWLASPQAAQGITCQKCHMPGRQHLWKGIHDKEMTLSGVTIESEVSPEAPRVGSTVNAVLRVTNTGTGHAFPTYTTPAVYVRAALIGADDRPLRGHYEEIVLQRRLDMSTSPWGEAFDTRLLPGELAELSFDRVIPEEAATLALWIWVNPDEFYNGFFTQRLDRDADFPGRAQLAQALEDTERRQYLLWSKRIPIAR